MFWLIPLSVVLFTANAALTKAFQVIFPARKRLLTCYEGAFCLFAAVAFLVTALIGAETLSLSPVEILMAALFGLSFFLAITCSALGYALGSMSLTSIIFNMSLFLPLLFSVLFLEETLSPLRIIGIALILLTMTLTALGGNDKKGERVSLAWLATVFCAFVANGLSGVIQKANAAFFALRSPFFFMSLAYAVAGILFFLTLLPALLKKPTRSTPALTPAAFLPRLLGIALLSGLASFGGNALISYLCNHIDGSVLFPCANGGICVLSALSSFLFFKEKLTPVKIIAMLLGVGAIVLLSL